MRIYARCVSSRILRVLVSAAAVAAGSGLVLALRPFAPVVSLGVLYVPAIVLVAIVFGIAYAIPVAIASMLAFNFFFLPPIHTSALRESANWVALGVYLSVAVAVGELAARSRRRTDEAEQRERESSFLASASAALLEADRVADSLKEIARAAGDVLGVGNARIELGSLRRAEGKERAYDLVVGRRYVGRLFADTDVEDRSITERVLPPLASMLAAADDRERLARAAVEAETLRRSDAVKTAVLRAVSHDLRSPITAIRAAGDGLARDDLALDTADREELLATIRTEAARLQRLVTNLIDLSRLEAGAATARPELWTVDDLVGRALETLGSDADRVVAELPALPFAALVDAAQIERVLVNVIENALKFSAAPVEVSASLDGERIAIRVRDHGPGLDPREAQRIFEPFERGGAVATSGTGLGLAIASGFAQANGATLSADAADGGGAVFILALPRAELPAAVRA
jgi:two-component system, OmpR family, sensor histidine kinase KdpD